MSKLEKSILSPSKLWDEIKRRDVLRQAKCKCCAGVHAVLAEDGDPDGYDCCAGLTTDGVGMLSAVGFAERHGTAIAELPIDYCPMCGRKLKGE